MIIYKTHYTFDCMWLYVLWSAYLDTWYEIDLFVLIEGSSLTDNGQRHVVRFIIKQVSAWRLKIQKINVVYLGARETSLGTIQITE